jgi:hypothetical protein
MWHRRDVVRIGADSEESGSSLTNRRIASSGRASRWVALSRSDLTQADLGEPRAKVPSMSTASLDYVPATLDNEFHYRPIPPLVPVAATFVALSLSAYAWDLLTVVPLVGSVIAWFAWRQVAREPGAYSGVSVAKASIVLTPLILVSALVLHAYSFATEVPEGFRRISFASDISDKGMVIDQGQAFVPKTVEELADQAVFLKGYMYPTKQVSGIPSFVLCKDTGDCCFGGQPKATDMIYIEMQGGKTVNYRSGMVSVAGVFKISPTLDPNGLNPVYKLDCDYFSPAKSSY